MYSIWNLYSLEAFFDQSFQSAGFDIRHKTNYLRHSFFADYSNIFTIMLNGDPLNLSGFWPKPAYWQVNMMHLEGLISRSGIFLMTTKTRRRLQDGDRLYVTKPVFSRDWRGLHGRSFISMTTGSEQRAASVREKDSGSIVPLGPWGLARVRNRKKGNRLDFEGGGYS